MNTEFSGDFRAGHVALAGLPNAGKSTLLNALLGEKISIISHRPQTTRNIIVGIKTTEDAQIAYVDTPGYHAGRGKLNKAMVEQADEAIGTVNVICVITDPKEKGGSEYQKLLEKVSASGAPLILVLTKLDDRPKESVYAAAEKLFPLANFAEVIPVSARTGLNLDKLQELVKAQLPVSEMLYPADEITTQPEKFLIAEYVREQAFALLKEEVPYDILVEVEELTDTPERMTVAASIIVARDSQKGIVIGKNGSMLQEIGSRARKEIAEFFGIKVELRLFVKVREDWASRDDYLGIQGL
jgi:GTP-binding protein Era